MRIVCTLGPSIGDKNILKELITCGVNTFRFNFSHGSIEDFNNKYKILKDIKEDIEIMVDLPGSKIRISEKLPYIYRIYNGEEILFCGEDSYIDKRYKNSGKTRIIPLNINRDDIENNSIRAISMKDNTMTFKVMEEKNGFIRVLVEKGGIVRGGKGCNIKGYNRDNLKLSTKDKEAINWSIKNKIDIICQSFVEEKGNVIYLKDYINVLSNGHFPKIWGKVETPKGIENVDSISNEVSGIVLGRGDLVPESSLIDAPIYQEKLLKSLKNYNGEIIIGTHILNSMKNGKMAEFSEVDSIYNLIIKGVDGFLLSGETSVGKAPIKTVRFLSEILERYKDNYE